MSEDMRFDLNARIEVWVMPEQIRLHDDYAKACAIADDAQRFAALRLIACAIARKKIEANSTGDFDITADVGLDAVNIDRIRWEEFGATEKPNRFSPHDLPKADCDHEWRTVDDSSDAEHPRPYKRCTKCDAEKECEPPSGP